MPIQLQKNMRILFQGDSITDAGRGKPPGLGTGYARIAADIMLSRAPELGLTIMNRGISGNRAKDLVERWGRDCVELKPDVVSIMIGINDTWRAFDSDDPTTAEAFEESYRTILERTRDESGAKIVMVEPFVLACPPDRVAWRADLDPKIGGSSQTFTSRSTGSSPRRARAWRRTTGRLTASIPRGRAMPSSRSNG